MVAVLFDDSHIKLANAVDRHCGKQWSMSISIAHPAEMRTVLKVMALFATMHVPKANLKFQRTPLFPILPAAVLVAWQSCVGNCTFFYDMSEDYRRAFMPIVVTSIQGVLCLMSIKRNHSGCYTQTESLHLSAQITWMLAQTFPSIFRANCCMR